MSTWLYILVRVDLVVVARNDSDVSLNRHRLLWRRLWKTLFNAIRKNLLVLARPSRFA